MNNSLLKPAEYLQRILKFAGYDCGKIDGIHGNKTNEALAKWLLDEDKAIKTFGRLDERSENNLQSLLPFVQISVRKWFKEVVQPWMKQNNQIVKIIAGTRTIAEQNALYAIGRTTAGKKVTNAKGGYSMHNFGIAFDIGLFTKSGEYITKGDAYEKFVSECGSPDEMLNGGSWVSLKDYPHFELAKYKSKSANVRKVWNKLQ